MARVCTRVLWNTNDLAVLTGRSMDWPESTEPLIVAFPRGLDRDGGIAAGITVVADNPLRWTSRYGSLVTTVYGVGAFDGINERGLAVHGLYLEATDLGPRDAAKPGLHVGLWTQYLLDQAATVSEALTLMDGIQLVMINARGHDATIHLAIEDASGDSAVVEFDHGRIVVHHGREYTLMTNDPTYEQQLELLSRQDFSNPGCDMPLPGNVNPIDRFQRAAYFVALLPEPRDTRQAVAGVMAIMRNVSVPFGAPYQDFGIYNTEYRTVTDLTNRTYFFELTTSPNTVWIELDGLDFTAGSEPKAINPYDEDLVGDVTSKFTPYQPSC
ncbi:choloylglycine hydrolase [Mycobacterium montefiorense]|uniref:Choloylglycine hydrolase n=1 Tax=Mycobacterium montefiorense TaxID=154654 RepID=A0AA37PKB9_9MYCO|nr:choloylglycine hydrolase [Mycobacterium montefiorense]GKU33588.1 choloylglycine hydrolase [Mycobacterium montefiorense]GKU39526.1 choloylglycine hydrolase [Mycobacterium montefiorense]GKU43802.1 choloylglycine hydrolase [Mycobacterium montefiorense]GKU52706.1 choloylglycine hydrolase [Mycobacterium montefiorense]